MYKFKILVIVAGLLVFGFQNCSPNTTQNLLADKPTLVVSSDQSSKTEPVVGFNFYNEKQEVINHQGQNFYMSSKAKFSLNLSTLELMEYDAQNTPVNKYCLNETLKGQLEQIISESQMCSKPADAGSSQFCAQAIQPAYAEIITQQSKTALGYATDSCGSNMVDFCDAEPIKAWIKTISENLNQLNCQ